MSVSGSWQFSGSYSPPHSNEALTNFLSTELPSSTLHEYKAFPPLAVLSSALDIPCSPPLHLPTPIPCRYHHHHNPPFFRSYLHLCVSWALAQRTRSWLFTSTSLAWLGSILFFLRVTTQHTEASERKSFFAQQTSFQPPFFHARSEGRMHDLPVGIPQIMTSRYFNLRSPPHPSIYYVLKMFGFVARLTLLPYFV